MKLKTYQTRDTSVAILGLDQTELGGEKGGWYSRRTSLLGTWDRAGLRRREYGEGMAIKNIREASRALDAGQESTDEKGVEGETEQTTEHGTKVEIKMELSGTQSFEATSHGQQSGIYYMNGYNKVRYCNSVCDVFTVFSFSSLITAENALNRVVPDSPASPISKGDQTLRDVSDVGVGRRRSRSR